MPYFLYFTKSRKRTAVRRKKDLIGFVQKCIFVCADSRFAKPRKVPKGFNFVCAKSLFGCADSRFGKPRISLQGIRIVTFCVVQKVTKKHVLGRAKSCLWQVFVRRRPPKQGELRTDVSKATMFQGVDSVLRPAIQISARYEISAEVTGHHHVTDRTGNCKLSGYRR